MYAKISKTVPLDIILPKVIEKVISKGEENKQKTLWCLNCFELLLCPQLLTNFHSFWQLVSHVIFQSQTDRTISFPKLWLLILSHHWLSRSESSKEITQTKIVPDVWTYLSQHCVFDLCDAPVFGVSLCVSCAHRTRKMAIEYLQNYDSWYYLSNGSLEVIIKNK